MPRKRRKENDGLPPRWRFYHGAYRYLVPAGQEHHWDGRKQFTLGYTLAEAYKVWAERLALIESPTGDIVTVADAIERYMLEVVPTKAARTQLDDRRRLPILAKEFGHATVRPGPMGIEPHHIYEYVTRNAHRLTEARRRIELLSLVFTMCVNWGVIDRHPWKGSGMMLQREMRPKPKRRYVEDWEILEVLSLPPRKKRGSVLMCQAYIRLKLLTGLRKTDMLWLPAQHSDDGLRVTPSKTQNTTGVSQLYVWTPELRAAVDMALEARPVDIAPWLFCTREGRPLIDERQLTRRFDSQWHRFMNRCLKETKLETRFAERNLRSKVATDAESLERAQALLAHADSRLTKRVYTLKPRPVLPAKGVKG